MGKYFGTDGFRGRANVSLTADHAYRIGRFIGWYYKHGNGEAGRILIGKDTRRSSYMLEYAIAAGIAASGSDAYLLHVTTTPNVSYITKNEEFDCGVMISASHNPYYDNGIKLVDSGGVKMDDETIRKIELYIDNDMEALGIEGDDLPLARDDKVGISIDYVAGRNRYIGYLISLAYRSFKGYRIGLDCANGSTWMIGRSIFEALGAKTYVINNEPNGININREAGSTHIEHLKKFVTENRLDAGFAYDGDADRCIAVDENGNEVCGDHMLYIFGKYFRDLGQLRGNKVVTTIMSNTGLYKALDEEGIEYEQVDVGDRNIYANMTENGYVVGGEQSGHIILGKFATAGDGLLTSIKLMEIMVENKTTLSKLAEPVKIFPQLTLNVPVVDKNRAANDEEVRRVIDEISKELGSNGRILLRKSGTEPVVRIMVEAERRITCKELAERLRDVIVSRGLDK